MASARVVAVALVAVAGSAGPLHAQALWPNQAQGFWPLSTENNPDYRFGPPTQPNDFPPTFLPRISGR